jgi:hypothetical protein
MQQMRLCSLPTVVEVLVLMLVRALVLVLVLVLVRLQCRTFVVCACGVETWTLQLCEAATAAVH